MTTAAPPEKMMLDAMIDEVIREVAELPDRTSPVGWPEAMLVTADELRAILREAARRLAPRVGDDAVREALLLYIHWGTLHENSECPEDDTCTCYVARTVNAALSAPPAASADEMVKHMVNRFLGWRLPENFNPDNGIKYEQRSHSPGFEPTGTNLFDADQAKVMVLYMLDGLASGWQPISTRPYSDDPMWFRRGSNIEGPRGADDYDADNWDWWSPCKPPALGYRKRAALPKGQEHE